MILINRIIHRIINRIVEKCNIFFRSIKSPAAVMSFSSMASMIVTFTLFWIMSFLVGTGTSKLDDSKRIRITDFISQDRDRELLSDLELLKPAIKKPPPPKPDQDFDNQSISNDSAVGVNSSYSGFDLQIGGLSASEGEYIPIVKVAPIYPQSALQRGVEGFCVVEYDVTEIGTVENPVVLEDSCSSSLFKRASVRASEKFKYKPRVVDGVPVRVVGVRNRFTYAIEK